MVWLLDACFVPQSGMQLARPSHFGVLVAQVDTSVVTLAVKRMIAELAGAAIALGFVRAG